MRILVMFDLPTYSSEDLKEYRKFRKFLIKQGFFMFQESIYSKIVLNTQVATAVTDAIRKNKPKKGFVTMLKVTEKQFNDIEILTGACDTNVVYSDKKVVIL